MRRRHPGVHPRGAGVFRDALAAAGKPLHARRPVEVVRRRRTESRHRVLARSAVDDHGADNHRRRRPHPYLFDRLHARRRRLLALLRMAQPVHLRDAGAGARRQHVADVRRLGRRRAVLVRADRVLVQGAGEHDGRQQGVHREPRRRPGVRDCALQFVRRPAGGRTSDAGDARGRTVRAAAAGSAYRFRRIFIGPPAGGIRHAADVYRRDRQVGADSAVRLAARRDGGSDSRERADPCGDDGDGGHLHGGAPEFFIFDVAVHDGRDRAGGRSDCAVRRDDRPRAKRHQESARVLDREPAWLHVRGARRGCVHGRRCSI